MQNDCTAKFLQCKSSLASSTPFAAARTTRSKRPAKHGPLAARAGAGKSGAMPVRQALQPSVHVVLRDVSTPLRSSLPAIMDSSAIQAIERPDDGLCRSSLCNLILDLAVVCTGNGGSEAIDSIKLVDSSKAPLTHRVVSLGNEIDKTTHGATVKSRFGGSLRPRGPTGAERAREHV